MCVRFTSSSPSGPMKEKARKKSWMMESGSACAFSRTLLPVATPPNTGSTQHTKGSPSCLAGLTTTLFRAKHPPKATDHFTGIRYAIVVKIETTEQVDEVRVADKRVHCHITREHADKVRPGDLVLDDKLVQPQLRKPSLLSQNAMDPTRFSPSLRPKILLPAPHSMSAACADGRESRAAAVTR